MGWVEDVEARIERYATDQDMPQAEWEVMGARIVMDAMRLLAVAKAAERLVYEGAGPYSGQNQMGASVCGFCGAEIGMYWMDDGPKHESDCPWPAFLTALSREGLTPTVS